MKMLQDAAVNNEQFREIAQQVKSFNGDPHQAFLQMAKQRGLSESDISEGLSRMENLLGISRPQ